MCVFICMCPYAFMGMHVQCMCVSCVYFLNNHCSVSLWEADASDYITRGHIHTSYKAWNKELVLRKESERRVCTRNDGPHGESVYIISQICPLEIQKLSLPNYSLYLDAAHLSILNSLGDAESSFDKRVPSGSARENLAHNHSTPFLAGSTTDSSLPPQRSRLSFPEPFINTHPSISYPTAPQTQFP